MWPRQGYLEHTGRRRSETTDHVLALSACADAHQDIAAVGKSCDLARKNLLICVIVGDRGQDGGIRRQSNRRARHAGWCSELAHQLARKVLRVRGTTSVAANEKLVPRFECIGDPL